MTGRVLAPIVVGVTGKRELNGREDSVRASFGRLFELLDERYPASPKILLSALAEGADSIAAEEALEREDWQVIAPLPLPLSLYTEDFSEAGAAALQTMLRNPRVRSFTLPPLLDAADPGKPLEPGSLRRQSGDSNPERTAHYEQVGLFIAERSTLLIAVMPAHEQAGRIGGTARIVKYRLDGAFDDACRDVLARSQELRAPDLLDDFGTGPVWLIDPAGAPDERGFPAIVQLPSGRIVGWPGTERRRLAASLALIDRLNRFNRRALALPDRRWHRSVEERAGPDTGDATAMLKHLRLTMSAIQVNANRFRKLTVFGLAALFSVAVAVVELREGFSDFRLLWWRIYLGAGVIAVVIYWVAARAFWQQIAEDYRAVAEALRVQIAWWDSGLTGPDHRVDRSFLCGTSGALALVRGAVRHCVNVALLLRESPPEAPGSGARWIDGQIGFFTMRIKARHRYLLAVETCTWILFLGAMGATALITLILLAPRAHDWTYDLLKAMWNRLPEGIVFCAALSLAILASLLAIRLQTSGILRWIEQRHPFVRLLTIGIVVIIGMIFAASLFDLAALLLEHHLLEGVANTLRVGAGLSEKTGQDPGADLKAQIILLGEALATVFAVVPAAIAGAVRYVAEKLSWEAELHGYEDALRTFQRAKQELQAIENSSEPIPAKVERRTDLLVVLGKEALEESESWIRAHRERLIEPVV